MYQERVRDIYDHLSPGYRRIADYLLNSYRDAAFMTAAEVGRAAQVDTTSVVRFAQRLGYPGFPELIAEVQAEVKRDLRKVYEPTSQDRLPADVFQRALIEERNNLDYILLHNNLSIIEEICGVLRAAPVIYLAGEAGAVHLAELFAMRLQSLGIYALALPGDPMGQMAAINRLHKGDAIIGIAPIAEARSVTVALRVAREEGARTIAVVNSPANRPAQVAEFVLHAPSRTTGVFYSLGAATAVLQALIMALTSQLTEQSADWAVRADYLLRRFRQAMRDEPPLTLHDVLSQFAVKDESAAGPKTSTTEEKS